jgi:hypothetical protein
MTGPAEEEKGWKWWNEITRTRRRMVFFYDILWLAILALIGFFLLTAYDCGSATPKSQCQFLTCFKSFWPLLVKYKVLINCMWLGALGGVTISLKGVYDHGNPNDPWSNAFNLWHIGRPISGAIAGIIVALLFILVFPANTLSNLVLYGVAFIFGTQDAAFFNFLSEFAARFVKTSKQGPVGVRINSITPPQATPGDTVTIQGQGFEAEATLKVGPGKIEKYTMTADGTTISGILPTIADLPAGNQTLDIIVMNKSGSSAALVGKFIYVPPKAAPKPDPAHAQ